MTLTKNNAAISIVGMALVLSFGLVNAASALTASCAGVPTSSNITWTASSAGGIAPIAYLWGNGSTSSAQTVAYAPGTYSMTIQAIDASSTVASSTCSATINAPVVPSIALFIAAPSTITVGQSSILSWSVGNASSTSINNGVGVISSTSVTVTPTVTTTYTLSAVNPQGTTTANATVTVNPVATTTPPTTGVMAQIQLLLAQINALKAQIAQLVSGQVGGGFGTGTTTPPVIVPPGLSCGSIGRDIRRGDYGDDIKDLQKFLAKHPDIYPEGVVNGFYGPLTMQAVKRWQKQNGVESTGLFGPLTRATWKQHCNNDDSHGVASSTPPMSSSTISNWINQTIFNGKKDDRKNGKSHGHEDN
ncbi:peptidoglycan-binding protein [Candidatus Kaiserbacteria bacterium]|nr:peptidoglycan-binding protein [Candidatus Kaiserbacteria bacterium]